MPRPFCVQQHESREQHLASHRTSLQPILEGSQAMQANCHEAPLTALATSQPALFSDKDQVANAAHFAQVAHHASDQFLYQGAVVLAIVLLLVSLWSL